MIGDVWRALRMEPAFYERVEADPTTTPRARAVVLGVGFLVGLGVGLRMMQGMGEPWPLLLLPPLGIAAALAGWLLWSAVTLWVGTRITFGPATEADLGQMLRTLGFASAPLALASLLWLPAIGGALTLLGALWALVAATLAVRQALDFTTGRALATVAIGWLLHAVVLGVLLLWGWWSATPVS